MNFLKIMHVNTQSLKNKIYEISAIMNEEKPDILTLNETFLKDTDSIKFRGYNMIVKNRKTKNGGGVAILVKEDIVYNKIDLGSHKDTESIGISLQNNKKQLYIFTIYSPHGNTDEQIFKDITNLTTNNIIITGDFNSKNTQWGSTKTSKKGEKLMQLLVQYNLNYMVNKKYTFHSHCGRYKDVIDLILCSDDIINKLTKIKTHNLLSDHCPISTTLRYKTMKKPKFQKRIYLYTKVNWQLVNKKLIKNFDNINITNKTELQTTSDRLFSEIQDIIKKIPTKDINTTHTHLPIQIRTLIQYKKKINKKWIKYKKREDKTKLNQINKKIKKEIQHYENCENRKLERKINDTNNPKQAWQTINKVIQKEKKQTSIGPIEINNKKINKEEELVETFKTHFEKIYSPEPSTMTLHNQIDKWHKDFFNDVTPNRTLTVNENNILDVIKTLKYNKSPGEDRISNKIIHLLSNALSTILPFLFNASLTLSFIPENWISGKIKILHKTNKTKSDINNYRPITLTSTIGKIFEKILNNYIYSWVENNKVINKEQNGFRRNKSTHNNINDLIEDIQKSLHKNQKSKQIPCLMIDLQKAFDKVWHNGLLYKLTKLGLDQNVIFWLNTFFNAKKIHINIGTHNSTKFKPGSGVPQGSCLSSTLFIIYQSDIPTSLFNEIRQFADDIVMWSKNNHRQMTKKIQEHINDLQEWCNKWKIQTNPKKTELIYFTRSTRKSQRKTNNIKINNQNIKVTNKTTFLGINFDHNMNFNEHFTKKINICYSQIQRLENITKKFTNLSTSIKKSLYFSLVRSHLDYSYLPYFYTNKKIKKKLQTIQNRALNKLFYNHTERNKKLQRKLKIPTIKERMTSLKNNFYIRN